VAQYKNTKQNKNRGGVTTVTKNTDN